MAGDGRRRRCGGPDRLPAPNVAARAARFPADAFVSAGGPGGATAMDTLARSKSFGPLCRPLLAQRRARRLAQSAIRPVGSMGGIPPPDARDAGFSAIRCTAKRDRGFAADERARDTRSAR